MKQSTKKKGRLSRGVSLSLVGLFYIGADSCSVREKKGAGDVQKVLEEAATQNQQFQKNSPLQGVFKVGGFLCGQEQGHRGINKEQESQAWGVFRTILKIQSETGSLAEVHFKPAASEVGSGARSFPVIVKFHHERPNTADGKETKSINTSQEEIYLSEPLLKAYHQQGSQIHWDAGPQEVCKGSDHLLMVLDPASAPPPPAPQEGEKHYESGSSHNQELKHQDLQEHEGERDSNNNDDGHGQGNLDVGGSSGIHSADQDPASSASPSSQPE